MRTSVVTTDSLRKDRLLLAKDFGLFYGHGKVKELSRFDVAIIDPKGLSAQDIIFLKNQDTLVIAYLSIMEVHPSEAIFSQLKDDDFLKIHHQRVINKPFGTYLVNLNSKTWMSYLLEEMEQRMIGHEVDGIFLDTVGDLDMMSIPPALREQQLNALTNLLYIYRLKYPHHLLIQNNGLETVCHHTISYIDGILWENPPLALQESQAWVKRMLDQFDALQKDNAIQVFLLFEETLVQNKDVMPMVKKLAKDKGYLYYKAPEKYLDIL